MSAGDLAMTVALAAVVVEGCEASECCRLLAGDFAQFWHADDEGEGGSFADARDGEDEGEAPGEVLVGLEFGDQALLLGFQAEFEGNDILADT